MIAIFCNNFVGYHIFMMKSYFKQPSQLIGRKHILFPYMQRVWLIVIIRCVRKWSFLTRWGRNKMTTICISFPNNFCQTTKISLQFVPKGAVNYKSKLVQAMAWHREDTKPLPGSVVIQANGALMSLSDWLSWLLHRIGKIYPCGEKTVLFEHTRDTFTPITESGQFRPLRLGQGEGRVDHIL